MRVCRSPLSQFHLAKGLILEVYFYLRRCSSIVPSESGCFSSVIVSQLSVENNSSPSLPPSLKTTPEGGSHVRRTCNFSSTGRRGGEVVSIGGGDETVLTPRWLLRVDVVEDSGQRNDLRELTSHPDVETAMLTHKNSLAAYCSSL